MRTTQYFYSKRFRVILLTLKTEIDKGVQGSGVGKAGEQAGGGVWSG